MSQVQRVIILNKPFKIRGYTVWQWILLASSLAIGFLLGSKVPHEWKFGNLPAGFILGLTIVCAAIVVVSASQMKPFAWWRNKVLYTLGFVPVVYLPKREEGVIYPDPTIKEAVKREDQDYVSVDTSDHEYQ
jgi:peptidoglycan/LPS O-acetylase OafA/YrhL